MENRKRRKFTAEFKTGAINLVRESGRSISSIARDLDLAPSVLSGWVQQADIDEGRGPKGALSTTEREELNQLRRNNRVLSMERDLLKKATAFFARENQ
jgi:transposase-like protein